MTDIPYERRKDAKELWEFMGETKTSIKNIEKNHKDHTDREDERMDKLDKNITGIFKKMGEAPVCPYKDTIDGLESDVKGKADKAEVKTCHDHDRDNMTGKERKWIYGAIGILFTGLGILYRLLHVGGGGGGKGVGH